jgi:hypothetical protein
MVEGSRSTTPSLKTLPPGQSHPHRHGATLTMVGSQSEGGHTRPESMGMRVATHISILLLYPLNYAEIAASFVTYNYNRNFPPCFGTLLHLQNVIIGVSAQNYAYLAAANKSTPKSGNKAATADCCHKHKSPVAIHCYGA